MNQALEIHEYEKLAVVDNPGDRLSAGWLQAVCQDLADAPKLMEAIEEVIRANPDRIKKGTLKRKYYAWKKDGIAGLVDNRKLRKLNRVNPFIECYMYYACKHNRSNKGGYDVMMERFWSGEKLEHGVGTWREWWKREYPHKAVPDQCPPGYTPKCAAYPNLQRDSKKNPDYLYHIRASRIGTKAAHEFLVPVLKTRHRLPPGSVWESDDVKTDLNCTVAGFGKVVIPLMYVMTDVASGHGFTYITRAQYPDASTGRRNSLKEREYRYLNADALTNKGFHQLGVRSIVEHGTTAIREPLRKRIKSIPVYGDLIKYEDSAILNEAVHAGLPKGDGGGNFRFKPYIERFHRIMHNARGMLAGQVGQDADHCPESNAAIVKYEEHLLGAMQSLTESERKMIELDLLSFTQFCEISGKLFDSVADNRNHSLEGWQDHMVQMWRFNELDNWRMMDELLSMETDQQKAISAFLTAHPEHRCIQRMTRREVYEGSRANFVHVPLIELPQLLDDRLITKGGDARIITVHKDGIFSFNEKFYWGDQDQVFYATCKTRTGFQQALIPKRKYLFFITPYHEDGVVVDVESGATIGVAPAYNRAPIYDRQAILEAAGKQNADRARKLMPLHARSQKEAEKRIQRVINNADVINGHKKPPLPNIKTTATINDLYEEQLVEEEW